MNLRAQKYLLLSLVMAFGGSVLAQDAGTPPPAEPPRTDLDVPMRARANVSATDMTRQVETYFKRMDEILRHIVQLQEVARREKDVIKLNCVNDKLLQIKQLVNIGEANKTNLDEAIARDDESGRYDFYSNITIANDQVSTLGAEAEQCIGQDLSFLGPTDTTVEGGNEPDDPTVSEEPDFPEVEQPPVASPFV
jgi:hypothetical protein